MRVKKRDFSKIPESDCLINYTKQRFNKGLYTLILATGLPGTGKSSVCQRLGQKISEKIHGEDTTNEKDVVDSMLQFLARIRRVKKPGEIIIIEEISVLFPSRRAMAKENVNISRVLETCRKKQVILLANAPIFNSIDSHIRQLGHILLETLKIIKSQEVVIYKSWKLQTNPHSGKTYRHTFLRNGRDIRLHYTRKPDSEMWEKYEENKDKFMDELYERLYKETRHKKRKEDKKYGVNKPKPKKGDLSAKELQYYELRYVKNNNNREASRIMKISDSMGSRYDRLVQKKCKMSDKKPKLNLKKDT